MKKKLLSITLALLPLVSDGESYFFEYAQSSKPLAQRIEGDRLHTVVAIRKIEAPKATAIFASYTGTGGDRDYQIQIDFKTAPAERWLPMVKLGDELITRGFSSMGGEDGSEFSYFISSADPAKIKAWVPELGKLTGVPEDRIEIDLTISEKDDPAKPIPVPVPPPDAQPAARPGEIAAAEYTDKSQRTIRFKVDGEDRDITAPEGKFWSELVVCKNKKVAYFLLNRGNRGGSWPEGLHRFVTEGPEAAGNPKKIPLKSKLEEVSISQIYEAAEDGSSLLVSLHYLYKKGEQGSSNKSYKSLPYFLNTTDGSVAPVKP